MKLSEAIRLGAMLLPQCFNYFELDDDGRPHACCALGGAALAAGYKRARYTIVMTFLNEQWGALLNTEALHPVTGDSSHVDSIIHDLNDPEDVHHWTRERYCRLGRDDRAAGSAGGRERHASDYSGGSE